MRRGGAAVLRVPARCKFARSDSISALQDGLAEQPAFSRRPVTIRPASYPGPQPHPPTHPPTTGLPPGSQELACLHADLLAAYFRAELALGAEKLKCRAEATTARLLAAIAQRDRQAAIFGARSRGRVKADEARVQRAAQVRWGQRRWGRHGWQLCGRQLRPNLA